MRTTSGNGYVLTVLGRRCGVKPSQMRLRKLVLAVLLAVIVIILFIVLALIAFGIYRLVHIVRTQGSVTTSSTESSGIVDG